MESRALVGLLGNESVHTWEVKEPLPISNKLIATRYGMIILTKKSVCEFIISGAELFHLIS